MLPENEDPMHKWIGRKNSLSIFVCNSGLWTTMIFQSSDL
jgi:hypothetical protein